MKVWKIEYNDDNWFWIDPDDYPLHMIRVMVCTHLQSDQLLDNNYESDYPHDLPEVTITEVTPEPTFGIVMRHFVGDDPKKFTRNIVQLPAKKE